MDQTMHNPEVYDFRQYDRIWQRVAPNLEPYPGMETAAQQITTVQQAAAVQPIPAQQMASSQQAAAAQQMASDVPAVPVPANPGQMGQLPGAIMNPCCMGSAASDMLGVLIGYIETALSDRRVILTLTRQAPSWARQTLRDIAADLQSHARQLSAAYYLITGQCYRPSVSTERIYIGRWCPALRERYHAAACSGMNYARSAEETTDPCLKKILEDLSEAAYGHAETLMGLLERSIVVAKSAAGRTP